MMEHRNLVPELRARISRHCVVLATAVVVSFAAVLSFASVARAEAPPDAQQVDAAKKPAS